MWWGILIRFGPTTPAAAAAAGLGNSSYTYCRSFSQAPDTQVVQTNRKQWGDPEPPLFWGFRSRPVLGADREVFRGASFGSRGRTFYNFLYNCYKMSEVTFNMCSVYKFIFIKRLCIHWTVDTLDFFTFIIYVLTRF